MTTNYADFLYPPSLTPSTDSSLYPCIDEKQQEPILAVKEVKWEQRNFIVHPHWYEIRKIVYTVGKIFLSLSAISAGATGYAALAFTATPMVVIATVSGLAVFTVATSISGIICFMRKTFWQDPAFLNEQSQKAFEDIQKEGLPYSTIQQKYGKQIQDYAILTNQDLNHLLRRDVRELDYTSFRQKHVINNQLSILTILDEENKAVLNTSFMKMVRSSARGLAISYQELLSDYAYERKCLNINLDGEIQDLLAVEIGSLSYTEFLNKCYQGYVPDSFESFSADNRASLINRFYFEKLGGEKLGFQEILQKYIRDCNALGINENELSHNCLRNDIQSLSEDNYGIFRSRNNLKDLFRCSLEDCQRLKEPLLKYLRASRRDGLLEVRRYPECKVLIEDGQLTDKEICDIILPQEIASVSQGQLSYSDYKRRNGIESFPDLIPDLIADSKTQLFSAILAEVKQSSSGLVTLDQDFKDEYKLFPQLRDQFFECKLPVELERLNTEAMTYKEFKMRNGEDAIQRGVNTHQDLLRNRFLKMSYENMISPIYAKDRNLLSIKNEDIEQVLKGDAQQLSYQDFRAKHGLAYLRSDRAAEMKDVLKRKLLDLLKGVPFNHIEDVYKKDCQLLNLDKGKILQKRWKNQSLQSILATDKQGFCQSIREGFFKAESWRLKFLGEQIDNVWDFFKKHREIFELKVIRADLGFPSLAQRFEQSIDRLTLEVFVEEYGSDLKDVFAYGLLSKESSIIHKLVIDYYLRKPGLAFDNNSNQVIETIARWNLKPIELERNLKEAKQKFNRICSEHNKNEEIQNKQYEQEVEQARLARDAKSLHLVQIENTYQQALNEKNKAELRVSQCIGEIRQKQKLKENLDDRQRQIKELRPKSESSFYLQAKESLEQQIESLQQQIQQINDNPVTGMKAAWQATQKQNRLNSELENLKRQLAALECKPKAVLEKMSFIQTEIEQMERSIVQSVSDTIVI